MSTKTKIQRTIFHPVIPKRAPWGPIANGVGERGTCFPECRRKKNPAHNFSPCHPEASAVGPHRRWARRARDLLPECRRKRKIQRTIFHPVIPKRAPWGPIADGVGERGTCFSIQLSDQKPNPLFIPTQYSNSPRWDSRHDQRHLLLPSLTLNLLLHERSHVAAELIATRLRAHGRGRAGQTLPGD